MWARRSVQGMWLPLLLHARYVVQWIDTKVFLSFSDYSSFLFSKHVTCILLSVHMLLVTGEYRYCLVQEAFDCIDRFFGKYWAQIPRIKPPRMKPLLTKRTFLEILHFYSRNKFSALHIKCQYDMMTGVAFKIFIMQTPEQSTYFGKGGGD